MVQYSTVQYSTVQYSTVQYSTVQYSTVQYSTVPRTIMYWQSLLYTDKYTPCNVLQYWSTQVVCTIIVLRVQCAVYNMYTGSLTYSTVQYHVTFGDMITFFFNSVSFYPLIGG
jgi:hypothetical protein